MPLHAVAGRRAWLVLVLLFALSLPAITPRIYASDEIEYFAFLRSLWFDRDLSFDNEYRYFYEHGEARTPLFKDTFLDPTTETGRRLTFGTIGCAILWAPFYAVADAAVRVARVAGSTVAADGYSQPYIAAVAGASAFYGFLALLLSLLAVARIFGPGAATDGSSLAAVLAVWLGTPLLFYMYIAPPMSHATSAFAVALFVLAWLHVRDRWSARGMVLLGVTAALMGMVREQDAFFVVGPALDFAWTLAAARSARPTGARPLRLVGHALCGAIAFVVAFLPQAAAYLVLNGHLGPSRLVSRKMTWTAPHAFAVLFSTEHGFLAWTPLAILALAGLVLLGTFRTRRPAVAEREAVPPVPQAVSRANGRDAVTARLSRARAAEPTRGVGSASPTATPGDREAPQTEALDRGNRVRVAVALLTMAAVQVYVAGSVESWTVAGAFGQRRFVALTSLLVIGLVSLFRATPRPAARTVLPAVLILCAWWNVGLIVQFGTGTMDRQRLELGRNARTSFVAVPRELPRLIWRYLSDRSSFYGDRKGR